MLPYEIIWIGWLNCCCCAQWRIRACCDELFRQAWRSWRCSEVAQERRCEYEKSLNSSCFVGALKPLFADSVAALDERTGPRGLSSRRQADGAAADHETTGLPIEISFQWPQVFDRNRQHPECKRGQEQGPEHVQLKLVHADLESFTYSGHKYVIWFSVEACLPILRPSEQTIIPAPRPDIALVTSRA